MRGPLLLGLISCGTFAPGALAQELSSCIKLENDLDRLACYDKASGRTPRVEKQDAPAGSKWEVHLETSAMTDGKNVFLHVDSNETVNCGWNRGDNIRLFVRCTENTTALIFSTGCHMTSSEYNSYGDVQYRLDDEPARKISMKESTNNRSLGLWSGGTSIPLIKQMFGKTKMTVRMTPYGENPFTATFDIAGLEEVAEPLRKACKW